MKKLNKNTKKAKQYIYNYNSSSNYALHDCYHSYSREKENIFNKYFNKCYNEDNGQVFKITTYSKFVITFGYIVEKDNKTYLYYITPSCDYIIEL